MLEKSLAYIKEQIGNLKPDTAIILGSGLGGLVSCLKESIVIDYKDIPDFPQTTVAGHNGCFYIGKIGKHCIICMQGRFHFYENIPPQLISQIIEMFKNLGVEQIFITNASGSLRTSMPEGSIMLIKDHINLSGRTPLIGMHSAPYFPDMSNAYSTELGEKFKQTAKECKIKIYEGVYAMLLGPSYETPSEVKLLCSSGLMDAVGMSTAPEVIASVHQGIKVLGVSIISNLATGLSKNKANHEDVLKTVRTSAKNLGIILQKMLEKE